MAAEAFAFCLMRFFQGDQKGFEILLIADQFLLDLEENRARVRLVVFVYWQDLQNTDDTDPPSLDRLQGLMVIFFKVMQGCMAGQIKNSWGYFFSWSCKLLNRLITGLAPIFAFSKATKICEIGDANFVACSCLDKALLASLLKIKCNYK